MKKIFIAILFSILFGCGGTKVVIKSEEDFKAIKMLAFLPFSSNVPDFAKPVYEGFLIEMLNGKLELADHVALKHILESKNISLADEAKRENYLKILDASGADALAIGNVFVETSRWGEKYVSSAVVKIYSKKSNGIIAAFSYAQGSPIVTTNIYEEPKGILKTKETINQREETKITKEKGLVTITEGTNVYGPAEIGAMIARSFLDRLR